MFALQKRENLTKRIFSVHFLLSQIDESWNDQVMESELEFILKIQRLLMTQFAGTATTSVTAAVYVRYHHHKCTRRENATVQLYLAAFQW